MDFKTHLTQQTFARRKARLGEQAAKKQSHEIHFYQHILKPNWYNRLN